jgi:hypothetical protein
VEYRHASYAFLLRFDGGETVGRREILALSQSGVMVNFRSWLLIIIQTQVPVVQYIIVQPLPFSDRSCKINIAQWLYLKFP